jgi:hypothetical protein
LKKRQKVKGKGQKCGIACGDERYSGTIEDLVSLEIGFVLADVCPRFWRENARGDVIMHSASSKIGFVLQKWVFDRIYRKKVTTDFADYTD